MAKSLPSRAQLVGYNHAVAGHDGILCDADGELLIKPCTSTEIDFYETSIAFYPEFVDLMPRFVGTLSLNDQIPNPAIKEDVTNLPPQPNQTSIEESIESLQPGGSTNKDFNFIPELTEGPSLQCMANSTSGHRIATDKAVVLENVSYGFHKPNILDVKLGVRLWADDAPEDKRNRFDKITAESTHKDLGFRIAGMRVWQGPSSKGEDVDEDGYKIYDKNYGRFYVNKDNVEDAFKSFIFNEGAGLNEELGKIVLQAFLADLNRIQSALESHENRMFSASLLFVFEGDGNILRNAMEEASTQSIAKEAESDDDEEDDEAGLKIYAVKLIDFAHAKWTPGNGPDENTLIGVRSVIKILNNLAST
ncbi:BgTH12-00226 [Blumeria graminis f. sp. triticale]|uniref:Kinase n=3 Tax=Blumeria graminis TaxID=34373 RepID=A0A9X9PQY1_BLUGR|nr:Inositol polyphosphate multikinase [Blumeria graminis f. sp. tritici 96224]CAD6504721.1 BgTH12-00226 [Blumeria graminis f. sp. triticale]VCU39477.1 Bgt-1610 [Blumeria graminis f. sp. tritici]